MKFNLFSLILLLNLFFAGPIWATHNRAGEITYRQLSDLTFEITVTTYTYTLSNVDREELEVSWGDGTYTIIPRNDFIELPDYYQRNRYIARHTFPGPGVYEVLVEDPNRNYGVENIPNSVNTVFSVKTTIYVNPEMGSNSTPLLLNPPINKAAQYRLFVHNPGAYDPDGDSLSYSLTECTGEEGNPIDGYTTPPATSYIGIDELTGDFLWNTPPDTGRFNVAIQIDEWRNGIKIGSLVRDMQIDVYETSNLPPENDNFRDWCVLAGDTLEIMLRSTDANDDSIEHIGSGGPFLFESHPATLEEVSGKPGEVISRFSWITGCNHIRKSEYLVLISARDNHPDINLVDVDNFLVQVIGPAPTGLTIDPGNAFMRLAWEPGDCSPEKYLIYRRIDSLDYTPDSCVTGLPDFTGYEFAGETTDTLFVDNKEGEGLVQGFNYCYRIVAEFSDGAHSYPSEEICGNIAPGFPVITNVSVLKTDEYEGEILLRWVKPDRLDTVPDADGPFKYIIYRSDEAYGMRLKKIDSIAGLDDTTFFDAGLNTADTQYSYEVALYNDTPGNRFKIGNPQLASSIFLNLDPFDNAITINIDKNTPWLDNEYIIYRLNNLTMNFDSIGYSTNRKYTDTHLANGSSYCYLVKSMGYYKIDTNKFYTENFSNQRCDIPEDFQRPCPPTLTVRSSCDSLKNVLSWNNPNLTCADDVIGYKIYYTNHYDNRLDSLDRLMGAENTFYEHFPEETMGACYAVSAVDSFYNESDLSAVCCIDDCAYYELPNVFSPNNDGVNDVYMAKNPLNYVEKVHMRIFNRWGELIFETRDPLIQWEGTIKNSNKKVAPGVYYYICDIWEPRITGIEVRNKVGFIHVYTAEGSDQIYNE
ncbi:MAG: gliding motility-associated C-terminal domain-containing protein [Bacteroidales bacterium]|jgi:gliding motility-associated-like protein|nr:gliding motility-associated C-terminal domain-containing protein [Bacteroidales bacterium]